MTINPRLTSRDQITLDALAACGRHKISALFITNEGDEICGMIYLQDLLAAGIA